MKILLPIIASVSVIGASAAHAATYDEIAPLVKTDAFSDVDSNWMRMLTNRAPDCGEFGSKGYTRAGALISKYRVLADAVAANDEASAMAAAKGLSGRIESSLRFKSCWKEISRRERIPGKFARLISKAE